MDSSTTSRPSDFITLLVVDDPTCHSIVTGILQAYKYEVAHYEKAADALEAIRKKKASLDVVVTKVHVPQLDRYELLKNIEKFKLPIILTSSDDHEQFLLESLSCGVALYIVEPSSANNFQNLWHHLLATTEGTSSGSSEATRLLQVPQRGKPGPKESREHEDMGDNYKSRKRQRLRWTKDLQKKFEEAIQKLEDDNEKAVPSKILDVMNIPELKRLHIASHLQKYRDRERQKQVKLEKNSALAMFWLDLADNSASSSRGNISANFSIPQENLQFPIEKSCGKHIASGFSSNFSCPTNTSACFHDSAYICDTQALPDWNQGTNQVPPSLEHASTFEATQQSNSNYLNHEAGVLVSRYDQFGTHSRRVDPSSGNGSQFGDFNVLPGYSTCIGSQMTTDGNSVGYGEMAHTDELMSQNHGHNEVSFQGHDMMANYMPEQFASFPTHLLQKDESHISEQFTSFPTHLLQQDESHISEQFTSFPTPVVQQHETDISEADDFELSCDFQELSRLLESPHPSLLLGRSTEGFDIYSVIDFSTYDSGG